MDVFDKCVRRRDIELASKDLPFYRPIEKRLPGGEVLVDGRAVLMAGSNDYLALSGDPRLQAAAVEAIRGLGTGNSGSRALNGTLALHEKLEEELAGFLGHEAAMVVSTGYQANLALSPLFGPDDVLFADRHVHASLVEAVRLGQARFRRYRHNDAADLARMLATADPSAGRLILTEGMFSTTGDLCDLPAISDLARRHGARVVLDGAHDIGLLGTYGGGVAEDIAVDVQTLTFSKCFGTIGGAVTGSRRVIDYLRYHARAALFSASLPAACTAAALAALDIIRGEPERRWRVLAAAERLRAGLAELGFAVVPGRTPTIPLHIGDTPLCLRAWAELLDEGIFTNAMIPPSVPEGRALIRLSVTADHGDAHLERVLDAVAAVGRRLNLIACAGAR
ncbi:aminotransferase class I/II-fold pyridoxal phosphate-dependent enzyme [Actinomadura fulvescens]